MDVDIPHIREVTIQRHFERPLLAAAVLSIPATILESTQVAEPWRSVGITLNWLIWAAFLAELIVMLIVVPNRRRYLLAHPVDIAIVVLTPPFFASAVQSVRVLRLLRVARLLRLKPLVRAACSLNGARAAATLALLTTIAGGAGFAAEENLSFGNGLYWAISTMTTVGGNITPHSTEGKIIAVIVMLVGIGTATLVIGAVAQRFITPAVEHVESTEDDLLAQVRDISSQLGRLERALLEQSRRSRIEPVASE